MTKTISTPGGDPWQLADTIAIAVLAVLDTAAAERPGSPPILAGLLLGVVTYLERAKALDGPAPLQLVEVAAVNCLRSMMGQAGRDRVRAIRGQAAPTASAPRVNAVAPAPDQIC